jgi:hypothetical protein
MKRLVERMMDEDWKSNVAAGLLGATLAASPASASAHLNHHQHKHTAHHQHHGLPHKSYSENDIINTIVGEAANQGYDGMLGIASAIRNRYHNSYYKNNILHGAYGINASHISKESPETFEQAKRAWAESKTRSNVGKAYLWGTNSDINKFQEQSWFKNVRPTVTIGAHTFFEDVR